MVTAAITPTGSAMTSCTQSHPFNNPGPFHPSFDLESAEVSQSLTSLLYMWKWQVI
ncbi:hypothetical protein CRENBAI_010193 [Crenichthys baileyi]|uniref:Uncharacterized protein n=1 Tax=Crenichthys baileyi TaxID=28760 RepID=A0AAV9R9T9_9TELE